MYAKHKSNFRQTFLKLKRKNRVNREQKELVLAISKIHSQGRKTRETLKMGGKIKLIEKET